MHLNQYGHRRQTDENKAEGYVPRSESHPKGCCCSHCVVLSCILCPEEARIEWRGLPGFSRHIQYGHPKFWVEHYKDHTISGVPRFRYNRASSVLTNPTLIRANINKAAREYRVIEEISKASVAGLRIIPTRFLDNLTRMQIERWVQGIKSLPTLRKKLFMEAVEKTTDKYQSEKDYKAALKAIQMIIEEATAAGTPTVVSHEIAFDPQVALEISKLSWTLNRSWSFVAHLLCLYGLKTISENLHKSGIAPPSNLSHLPMPSKIIAADEERVLSLSRFLRKDNDKDLEAYGSPDDEEFNEVDFFNEDLGETPHDREIHEETEEEVS